VSDLVPVRVRDCACPGTPHDEGDVISLHPKIGLEGGLAAQQDVAAGRGDVDLVTRRWMVTFVRYGVAEWNLVDESGPRPLDIDAILADYELAGPVADAAADLYTDMVLRPLVQASAKTSPSSPTVVSMSRARKSTHSRRRSSSPPASDGQPLQAQTG
jgi:hypothetical protein